MKLVALLGEIGAVPSGDMPHGEVMGVTADSRQIRPGFLFVAVRGTREDGQRYVADAAVRGAVGVVCDRAVRGVALLPQFIVPDAARALAHAAAAFYGWPSRELKLLGITGTNGKTTTAYMLWDVLRELDYHPGLLGTVEYRIGARVIPASLTTPGAVDLQRMLREMHTAGSRACVMEVSSHALHQHRVDGIDFDVAIFTNLTHDHLDYHKTMQDYFEAKALLFSALGVAKPAAAVINLDDPWGIRLAERALNAQVITYGVNPAAAVRAHEIAVSSAGSTCKLSTPWGAAELRMSLLGRFNISNALAAVAACGAMGFSIEQAASVLGHMENVPGRMERVETGRDFQVFVDYAHTDDALRHVLTTLREITRNRLIVVFGCGGDRDRAKRPAMGAVAVELADYAIVTTDNPRSEAPGVILAEIEQGMQGATAYCIEEERAAAITRAVRMAEAGDIVLIAGKGHERFQKFANTTVAFDDREIVRKWRS